MKPIFYRQTASKRYSLQQCYTWLELEARGKLGAMINFVFVETKFKIDKASITGYCFESSFTTL